jgi:hypothetical protein
MLKRKLCFARSYLEWFQFRINGGVRPSAGFHKAPKDYQCALNSSKFANVSRIEIGAKVLASVDGKEVQDEVCYNDWAKETSHDDKETGNVYVGTNLNNRHLYITVDHYNGIELFDFGRKF